MKTSRWPLIIGGMLSAQVLASAFFVYLATSDPSYAVEEDYYQKALAWDQHHAADLASRSLGWQVELRLSGPIGNGTPAAVELELRDASGAPVTGASVHLEALAVARAGDILEAPLDASGGGRYSCRLPMTRPGRWELRISAERSDAHYSRVLELYVDETVGGRISG